MNKFFSLLFATTLFTTLHISAMEDDKTSKKFQESEDYKSIKKQLARSQRQKMTIKKMMKKIKVS